MSLVNNEPRRCTCHPDVEEWRRLRIQHGLGDSVTDHQFAASVNGRLDASTSGLALVRAKELQVTYFMILALCAEKHDRPGKALHQSIQAFWHQFKGARITTHTCQIYISAAKRWLVWSTRACRYGELNNEYILFFAMQSVPSFAEVKEHDFIQENDRQPPSQEKLGRAKVPAPLAILKCLVDERRAGLRRLEDKKLQRLIEADLGRYLVGTELTEWLRRERFKSLNDGDYCEMFNLVIATHDVAIIPLSHELRRCIKEAAVGNQDPARKQETNDRLSSQVASDAHLHSLLASHAELEPLSQFERKKQATHDALPIHVACMLLPCQTGLLDNAPLLRIESNGGQWTVAWGRGVWILLRAGARLLVDGDLHAFSRVVPGYDLRLPIDTSLQH
ncbi:hypothetical protein PWT90_09541 [Aphanocladium album]|nr:hypothetical protein PWT90_09541 [Aphanocladium album]